MKKSPINFISEIKVDDIEIRFENLNEVCQGGPVFGDLLINDINFFPKNKFGGPLLNHKEYLFVPVLVRKFFSSYFQIGKINLEKKSLIIIKGKFEIIILDRIIEDNIYFFTDLMCETEKHIDI